MPKRAASSYDPVERRIRAAMRLAGVEFAELAERIDSPNLGVSTLRRLNASRKPVATALHLREIARACEMPYEFFTVDFNRLPELERQPVEQAGSDQAEMIPTLVDLVTGNSQRLAALEKRVNRYAGEWGERLRLVEDKVSRPDGDRTAERLQELGDQVRGMAADLEVLSAEVTRRNGASGGSTRDLPQRGQRP